MRIKNIGLALSGGGYRAAVFHMGVLARLAEDGLLEEVAAISSVSGGSLGTALIMAMNNLKWPTSKQYFDTVIPKARERLTAQDLQADLISRAIYSLITLNWGALLTRADDLSRLLRERWGIKANLSDLPHSPQWFINTTCYETGKDWRFEKNCAGDYVFGYTRQTNKIPLSDAIAASSGFPGLVGALPFDTRKHDWSDDCYGDSGRTVSHSTKFQTVHLWDGGVYDNNGLEVFYDPGKPRWQRGIEFLVVSDATGKSGMEEYRIGVRALFRIVTGIMMAQVHALRIREIVALMSSGSPRTMGTFLRIGNTAEQIMRAKSLDAKTKRQIVTGCLSNQQVAESENLQTEIRRLAPAEFRNLFRHGFEVADCALFVHHSSQFQYIGYDNTHWSSVVT